MSILILTVFLLVLCAFYDHGQPGIRQAAQLCISKNVTFGRCQRCLAKRRRHYLTISVSIRCHHLLIRNYAALLLTWFPSSSPLLFRKADDCFSENNTFCLSAEMPIFSGECKCKTACARLVDAMRPKDHLF